MSLVPEKRLDKIAFFRGKIATWTAAATSIGTTVQSVTDLEAKVTAAQDLVDDQVEAHSAARTATQAADQALKTMADAGADIIQAIRAKAAVSGPGIWTLADLPAPATPQPVVTLGEPRDFKVALNVNGTLGLKWKCASPRASGMSYEVMRRIGGAGEFVYIGSTGTKSFVDGTLPAGAAQVTYQVRAVRSTATGPWAQFNVNFGVNAGGQLIASISTAPRAAA